MSFHTHKSFVHLRNTIYDILDETRDACDCPIDCQVILTIKVQKSMKSIIRVVHLPSVVESEFYNATRILFVCKENKNNYFFQKCVSSLSLHVTVAYALLYEPRRTDALFSFKSKRKYR